MKITLKLPIKSNLIVFGNENIALFSLFRKSDTTYSIYDVENKEINLHIFFVLSFILNFILNILELRSFKKYISNIYHLTNINLIKPKTIITNIDNNTIFHWISKKTKKSKCIAIQNGLRTRYEFDNYYQNDMKNYYHDIYCALNQHELDNLVKRGIIINSPKAIGSLRLEMFLESKKIEFKNRYDICLISEYFSNPKGSYGRKLKFHIEQMNDFLSRYIKKNNKSIVVALNDTNLLEQRKYYQNLFPNADFTTTCENEYASYDSICHSNITIALFSTMILEALSLGKKALSVDFSNSDLYFNYNNKIKFTINEYTLFENKINEILISTYEDYRLKINLSEQELVLNDEISPQKTILNILEKTLIHE